MHSRLLFLACVCVDRCSELDLQRFIDSIVVVPVLLLVVEPLATDSQSCVLSCLQVPLYCGQCDSVTIDWLCLDNYRLSVLCL